MRAALLILAVALGANGHSQENAGPAAPPRDLLTQAQQQTLESDCVKLVEGKPHSDSLALFCKWVLTFRENLPNILADETMDRLTLRMGTWRPRDTLTMQVRYERGRVNYSELRIDGKPTAKTIFELGGIWSTGELGPVLEGLVADVRKSGLKFVRAEKDRGKPLLRFEFNVPRSANGSWVLVAAGNHLFVPGYKGSLLIEKDTGHCVTFERQTTDVDPDFPTQFTGTVLSFRKVPFADGTGFVVPVSSQETSCQKKVTSEQFEECARLEATFKHWRKFGAAHRILEGGATVGPN